MTATCVPPCVEMMVQAPPFLWLPSDQLLLGGVPHTSSCQRPGPRPPTEASEATSEAAGLPVHEPGSGCSGHSVSWGTRNGPSLTYTTTRVSPGCVILEPGEVGLGPSVLRARNTLEGHGFWLLVLAPQPVHQCCSAVRGPPSFRRVSSASRSLEQCLVSCCHWYNMSGHHALCKHLYLISSSSFNVTRGKYYKHGKCYKEEVLDITQFNLV